MSSSGEAIARWAGVLLAGIIAGSLVVIWWRRRGRYGSVPYLPPREDTGKADRTESRWRGYLQACLRGFDSDIQISDDLDEGVRIAAHYLQLQGRKQVLEATSQLISQVYDLMQTRGLEDRVGIGINRVINRIGLLEAEWKRKFIESYKAVSGASVETDAVTDGGDAEGIPSHLEQVASDARANGRTWSASRWTYFVESSVAAGALTLLEEMKRRMQSVGSNVQPIAELKRLVDEELTPSPGTGHADPKRSSCWRGRRDEQEAVQRGADHLRTETGRGWETGA